MYDYQSYLSGNRSLLGANGPGYEYAPQFPSHLRQWQEQGYDTVGISAFAPTYRRKRRSQQPGYQQIMSPGGVPHYRYQQPGQRELPQAFGAQYMPAMAGGGARYYGGSQAAAMSYQQPPRYGYF
jgi:hypothetical protein